MGKKDGYVVVRGGVSGAGRYISLRLAQEGYGIFAHTLESAHNFRGDILKEECAELGVPCGYDSGDPSDYAIAQQIVRDADAQIGGRMIAYINNDGVVDGARLPELSPAQYRELLDVHFMTLFNCVKTAADHMAKQGGGHFINTVCMMGFPGTKPDFSLEISLYEAFTRSFAKTYAPMNVRFNTILSAPLAYPQDPQDPNQVPESMGAGPVHPPMSTEAPDEFLELIVKIVESPGMNGQVFAANLRF